MHNGFLEALTKPTEEIPRKMGTAKISYKCQIEDCGKFIPVGQFHYPPSIHKKRIVGKPRSEIVRRRSGW